MDRKVSDRISQLEEKLSILTSQVEKQNSIISELKQQLNQALDSFNMPEPDLQNVMLKLRSMIEKILNFVYKSEYNREPGTNKNFELTNILSKDGIIEVRVKILFDSVRTMTNYGVHGGELKSEDAVSVFEMVSSIINWFIDRYSKREENTKNIEVTSIADTDSGKITRLEQFWREEQEALQADAAAEEKQIKQKYDFEEIVMRQFIGDPQADEMLKSLMIDIENMSKRLLRKSEETIENVKEKVRKELNS